MIVVSTRFDGRIEVNPAVMVGKPVIAGTRITVEFILEALAAGEPLAQLVEEYPITRDDVLAALSFAAQSLNSELVYPLASGQ